MVNSSQRTLGARARRFWRLQLADWQLYLLVLLPVAHVIIFAYIPMYGVQIAFKDFKSNMGILGSPWVGFKHFERFFGNYQFERIITNTLRLGLGGLIFGFPMPVIFAIMLNELTNQRMKKLIQTVSYAPYFISITVLAGMIMMFLSLGY